MKSLNAASFPLKGQQLIEASAGTGKTFTIANLYLRVLLGHQSPVEALSVDRILVVTFTRAATEELRGRIRQRIRDLFESLLKAKTASQYDLNQLDDAFLQEWLEEVELFQRSQVAGDSSISSTETISPIEQWLQANLSQMDEAAVFTIHGFCQRILQQFAFDTGALFSSEMILETQDYLKQAAQDCWRRQIAAIDEAEARYLLSQFKGPDEIASWVARNLQKPQMQFKPFLTNKNYGEIWAELKQVHTKIIAAWATAKQASAEQGSLLQLIQDSGIDKRSYSSRNLPNWYQKLDSYCSSEEFHLADDVVFRFSQSLLNEKTKKGDAPAHLIFELIEQLEALQLALSVQLKQQVFLTTRTLFYQALEQAGKISPDDLLRFLAEALNTDKHPEQAERLSSLIRQQYPIAMIDEFQDTDPLQYQIFNNIYGAGNQDSSGLYMIGDPKQAIYGFRGADIFTYIEAKRALSEEQKFTLDTNWRSHTQLVQGVNELWQLTESPFIYDQDITFHPVNAAGKCDDLSLVDSNGQAQSNLQCWTNAEPLKIQDAKLHAAERCAESIVALLKEKRLKWKDVGNNENEQEIQSSDIAVLVRSHNQAALVKQALLKHGIVSVFLSRESVYESREALDILVWLQALHHPDNEGFLRNALACETLGLSANELHQVLSDELLWEQQLKRCQQYRELFHQRGVMAFLMKWLSESRLANFNFSDDAPKDEELSLAARIRQQSEGERKLTNILHIGEQLQQASRQLYHGGGRLGGEKLGSLVRWLSEKCLSEQSGSQEQQLRLESDAGLVNIVTIHKSKGLQYPIVFLPFLWDDTVSIGRGDCIYHDENNQLVNHLLPDDQAKKMQEREAMAENLRLLYVALTRAEIMTVVQIEKAISNKKSTLHKTALGHLFNINAKDDIDAQLESIELSKGMKISYPELSYVDASIRKSSQTKLDVSNILAKKFTGRWYDNWRVTSYSQLIEGASHHTAVFKPEAANNVVDTEESAQEKFDHEAGMDLPSIASANELSSLTFPKGATPGSCLHAILEYWDFVDLEQLSEQVAYQLQHYGIDDKWQSVVEQWMITVVSQPLTNAAHQTFTLNALGAENRLDEMEFYLPMNTLRASELEVLLSSVTQGASSHEHSSHEHSSHEHSSGAFKREFAFDEMKGQMKGYIDLIFRHKDGDDERYYVADYKSNHLGDQFAAYMPDNLNVEMQSHYYDLQYWIYTVALDQYLSKRIADYDYDQHFGGVYYLFLRGMSDQILQQGESTDLEGGSNTTDQSAGVFFASPTKQQVDLWRKWLLSPETVSTASAISYSPVAIQEYQLIEEKSS